jgi:hypothetical protein
MWKLASCDILFCPLQTFCVTLLVLYRVSGAGVPHYFNRSAEQEFAIEHSMARYAQAGYLVHYFRLEWLGSNIGYGRCAQLQPPKCCHCI